jgi:streptogramin lyase
MTRSGFLALAALALAGALARPGAAGQPRLDLNGKPLQLVAAGGSLWVLTCDRGCTGEARTSVGRIVRIDPSRARVTTSVPLRRPQVIAVDRAGVYSLDFWKGDVYRLDPRTLEVTHRVHLVLPYRFGKDNAFLPYAVATGEGAVWVSTARGAIAKVDRGATRVARTIRLPPKLAGDVAAGEGGVWVAAELAGIYRIDPGSDRITSRIVLGPSQHRLDPNRLLLAAGRLLVVGAWADAGTLAGGNGLAVVDPATGRVQRVSPLPGGWVVVAYGAGSLWAGRVGSATLERIDPRSGTVIRRIHARIGTALAVAGGYVWTADRDGVVRRIAVA